MIVHTKNTAFGTSHRETLLIGSDFGSQEHGTLERMRGIIVYSGRRRKLEDKGN